jgi:hypothetical protein
VLTGLLTHRNRVRVKIIFARGFNAIGAVRSFRANIHLSFYQKIWLYAAIPPHEKGRTRRHDT